MIIRDSGDIFHHPLYARGINSRRALKQVRITFAIKRSFDQRSNLGWSKTELFNCCYVIFLQGNLKKRNEATV